MTTKAVPPPINPNAANARKPSAFGASFNAAGAGVQPTPTSSGAPLKEPKLYDQPQFRQIGNLPEEQAFWRSRYYQANKVQQNQSLQWKVLVEELQSTDEERTRFIGRDGRKNFDKA